MKGNLTRRGRHSWRLKYDVSDGNGQRGTRYVTLRGTRREAQAQAVKVLASVASGMHRGAGPDLRNPTGGAFGPALE